MANEIGYMTRACTNCGERIFCKYRLSCSNTTCRNERTTLILGPGIIKLQYDVAKPTIRLVDIMTCPEEFEP